MAIQLRTISAIKKHNMLASMIDQIYLDESDVSVVQKNHFRASDFLTDFRSFSPETTRIEASIKKLTNALSPSSYLVAHKKEEIKEKLFEATAAVKIKTAQVGMYLDGERKKKIFNQLDSLHNLEDWEKEDKPVELKSYSTFLKALLLINPSLLPGLGLSSEGHLLASWVKGCDRLILEFLDKDQVRWVLSKLIDEEYERASGQGDVAKIMSFLSPYSPQEWFKNA